MYELSGFSIVNNTPFLLRSMNNSATNIANLLASSTLWASRPLSVGSPAGGSLDLKGGGVGAPKRCKAAGMGLSRALDIVPQGGPAWAYRMPSLSISWRTARCPVGSAKSNRTTVAWVACLLRSQSTPNASRPASISARVRPADPAHNSTALGRTGAGLVLSVLAQGIAGSSTRLECPGASSRLSRRRGKFCGKDCVTVGGFCLAVSRESRPRLTRDGWKLCDLRSALQGG